MRQLCELKLSAASRVNFSKSLIFPGEIFNFRVKAVNKEGASDALTTDKETLAKNPYEEPGKPKTPEVVDWDADRVSLEWQPPDSDGGAPITQYIIEKRGKHGREWQECAKVSGDHTSADVLGLKEGEEYQFRVKAVNKAGPGEASDPSRKVVAKPRNCKFFGIYRRGYSQGQIRKT